MSYCEGLPCIPTLSPPSVHLSLYRSPRPSAPPSPPSCCLMVQLLRNTLEHGLRDQGYCDGSPSRLNQKKRQKNPQSAATDSFICHGWRDDCQKHTCSSKPDRREHCRWSPSCLHILVLCSFSRTDIYNSRLPLQCATYHL